MGKTMGNSKKKKGNTKTPYAILTTQKRAKNKLSSLMSVDEKQTVRIKQNKIKKIHFKHTENLRLTTNKHCVCSIPLIPSLTTNFTLLASRLCVKQIKAVP